MITTMATFRLSFLIAIAVFTVVLVGVVFGVGGYYGSGNYSSYSSLKEFVNPVPSPFFAPISNTGSPAITRTPTYYRNTDS
jgi:hypothetical protein